MTKPRRRQAGEGGISEYQTKAGPRFLIKYAAPREDGSTRYVLRRGFPSRQAAAKALREQLTSVDKGVHVAPAKIALETYLSEWLDGLRLSPSTLSSYRKNVRLHVVPHVGQVRLDQLTGTRLTALYRKLEREGRADGAGGLSAKTVRYIHTIIGAALKAAVRDGRLAVNPADKASTPSAREARSPEMSTWTASQLQAFLDWSQRTDDVDYVVWLTLAMSGMRRGELLALCWADIDFDAGVIRVRRSVTVIKNKGVRESIEVGPPKSGRSRVVDMDPDTLAKLKGYRSTRASLSLSWARPEAIVFGRLDDGQVRHPERFSDIFQSRLREARNELGADAVPRIRLHDLRHTHATLLLRSGQPVKVVSERLGHASPMITLGVYAHVMPGMQREAAASFAAMVFGGGA